MARPIRIEFSGAVYHVMARGNDRRSIYRDDQDRQTFLATLAEMVQRFGVKVHAYCLMPNHYHLVLTTPVANLSQAVGWLQVTYTVRFNRRHRRSGHLFQGRFKAQLVEADEYAQWLVEYVHLNPVRPVRKSQPLAAERQTELDGYEWSSHRDYAGLREKTPEWLTLDWWRYWGGNPSEAQTGYRERIQQAFGRGVVESPWGRLRSGLVLGGEALWEKAKQLAGEKQGQEEKQLAHVANDQRRAVRVREMVNGEADWRLQIWARLRLGGERGVDVAREYGYRDGSGVALVVRRLEKAASRDTILAEKLTQLAQLSRE
jgi:putative transposase